MRTPLPFYFRNIPVVASGTKPVAAAHRYVVPIRERLTPYEAAAKAIFVRANGAPAYDKAMGVVRNGEPAKGSN